MARQATPQAAGKTLREGSSRKREAILAAARRLFLTDGFERTSVDAIAAQAEVSKRTVYDYFGDKRNLLLSVVRQAVYSLTHAIRQSIDENLGAVDDLETSLIAFARSVSVSAIGSPDYTALMRLVSMESDNLPELRTSDWSVREPEIEVAERFAEFGRQGLLEVPNPRLAADHFVALTLLPVASSLASAAQVGDEQTEQRIVDGVRAFLRAYAPRT